MRILVAEEDATLAHFLRERLQNDHFTADHAPNGAQALKMSEEQMYDLVILDLAQPADHGLGVLREVRAKKPDMLFLMLMSSNKYEDRINALDAGADDCVAKPFSFAELSARVRALLRRNNSPGKVILKVDDLELDRIGRTVRRSGCLVNLTQKEFALLEFLMQRPHQAVPRTMIAANAWKLTGETITNVVDVYINYLRKKIDLDFSHPLIRTVRGVGYQIGGASDPA